MDKCLSRIQILTEELHGLWMDLDEINDSQPNHRIFKMHQRIKEIQKEISELTLSVDKFKRLK